MSAPGPLQFSAVLRVNRLFLALQLLVFRLLLRPGLFICLIIGEQLIPLLPQLLHLRIQIISVMKGLTDLMTQTLRMLRRMQWVFVLMKRKIIVQILYFFQGLIALQPALVCLFRGLSNPVIQRVYLFLQLIRHKPHLPKGPAGDNPGRVRYYESYGLDTRAFSCLCACSASISACSRSVRLCSEATNGRVSDGS